MMIRTSSAMSHPPASSPATSRRATTTATATTAALLLLILGNAATFAAACGHDGGHADAGEEHTDDENLLVIQEATISCPPPVTTVANFSLSDFISARWYVQQQMNTVYLPETWNRCVYADYSMRQNSFWGYVVQVRNHAEEADGTIHDSGNTLCAGPGKVPSKLTVGPCFLPRFTNGPYWVVAYDESEGYALISGGAPTKESNGLCKSGTGINDSGLWVFTRVQTRDDELVQKVRGIALAQGFDLSVLNDIDQTYCAADDQ